MKHKIYHVCTRQDAKSILKNGFKKPAQEVMLSKIAPAFPGGQGGLDVVSFSADNVAAWAAMKGIQKILGGNVWPLEIDLVSLVLEVDEKEFLSVFISAAVIWTTAKLPFIAGTGIEILVGRKAINAAIKSGKGRIVDVTASRKNTRLLAKAKAFELPKEHRKSAKAFATAHNSLKRAIGAR